MKTFYFSATGNCLAVAKKIGGELISIPKALQRGQKEFSDDVIGIVFPCYCLIAPKIVCEFIENVSLHADYIFAVMTYGNFSCDGVHWFSKFCAKHGIHINYGQELLMVDNYLPMFDMKQQKAMDKNTEEYLGYIVSDIRRRREFVNRKNVIFRGISSFMPMIYNKMIADGYKKFSVNDSCNSCGMCAKVCPRNNVTVDDKPVFGSNCEFCLGCINLCPTQAIKLKGEKNPNERFKNDAVTLNEIIQSNE